MRCTGLVCAVVLLLAGCVSFPPADSETNSDNSSNRMTLSCEPGNVPIADSTNESRQYPSPPTVLNRSTVKRYVSDFERAFAWHRVYSDSVDDVYVYVHRVEVEATDGGYLVRIKEVTVNYYEGKEVGSDAWSAFYQVNGSIVLRGEGHAGAPAQAPPRSEWTTVCR